MRVAFWLLLLSCVWISPLYAAQIVTPSQTSITLTDNRAFDYQLRYSVTAPETLSSTGLGLRIHYNSHALTWVSSSNLFALGLQPVGEAQDDTTDNDQDADTDKYFVVAWLDSNAQWPTSTNTSLLTASFKPVSSFVGTTYIRASASATVYNASFTSTPMKVTLGNAVNLKLKAILQGAYDNSSQLMRDALRADGLLPLKQPYAYLGYKGLETTSYTVLATTGNTAPVDWVLVELYNPMTQTSFRKAALIQRNGQVVEALNQQSSLIFNAAPAAAYYVRLWHRNHLSIRTAKPINLGVDATFVDFSNSSTPTYGTHAAYVEGTLQALWAGDVNQDAALIAEGNNSDRTSILALLLMDSNNESASSNFQIQRYDAADLNLDGIVLYAGPNNDTNVLFGNILLHPANVDANSNFIVREAALQ